MKRCWVVLIGLVMAMACGCTRQEKAQQELITRLQGGLRDINQVCDERQAIIDDGYALRRQSLDDAFDEDVRRVEAMDAAWVIEHRKAYVAGLEAIWGAQRASHESHRQAMENLQAVSDGLERLRWISEMRQGWGQAFQQVKQEVSDESR